MLSLCRQRSLSNDSKRCFEALYNYWPTLKSNMSPKQCRSGSRPTSAKRRLFDNEEESTTQYPDASSMPATRAHERARVVLDTPQKKRRVVDAKAGTPQCRRDLFERGVAIVTPPKHDEKKEENEPYVPIYIHKNLNYKRKGEATITTVVKKTFKLGMTECSSDSFAHVIPPLLSYRFC